MLQPRAPWHPGQQCAGGLLTRRWCLPPPGAPRDGQRCVARSAGAPPAPRSAISLPAPRPDQDLLLTQRPPFSPSSQRQRRGRDSAAQVTGSPHPGHTGEPPLTGP